MTRNRMAETKQGFLKYVLSFGENRKWDDESAVMENLPSRLSYAMDFIGIHETSQKLVLMRLYHEDLAWVDITRSLGLSVSYDASTKYHAVVNKLAYRDVVYEILNRGIDEFKNMLVECGKDFPLSYIQEFYRHNGTDWAKWSKFLQLGSNAKLRDLENFTYKDFVGFSYILSNHIRALAAKYGLSISEE